MVLSSHPSGAVLMERTAGCPAPSKTLACLASSTSSSASRFSGSESLPDCFGGSSASALSSSVLSVWPAGAVSALQPSSHGSP